MIKNKFWGHDCKKILISLLLIAVTILLIFLIGRYFVHQSSGEPSYITDVQIMNGSIWCLRYEDGGYVLTNEHNGQKVDEHLFPKDSFVKYAASQNLYYYASNGVLYSYCPVSKQVNIVCDSVGKEVPLEITDNFVVLSSSKTKNLLKLSNNAITESAVLDAGSLSIFDVSGNEILLWRESNDSLCIYDCESDSYKVILDSERDASRVMVTAVFYENKIFYAETDGKLFVAENSNQGTFAEPVQVTNIKDNVVAISPCERGLVCAVKTRVSGESGVHLTFFLYTDEGVFEEIGVWENSDYYLPGSCLLKCSKDHLICAVTTEPAFFVMNF